MEGKTPTPAVATPTRPSQRRFWVFAVGAGVLALLVAGVYGGVLAFGTSAAMAWRSRRSRPLKWTLTVLAVLCTIAAVIVTIDSRFGTTSLVVSNG